MIRILQSKEQLLQCPHDFHWLSLTQYDLRLLSFVLPQQNLAWDVQLMQQLVENLSAESLVTTVWIIDEEFKSFVKQKWIHIVLDGRKTL